MHKNSFRIVLAGLAVLLSNCFCILTPRPSLEFKPDQMPAARVGQPFQTDILVTGNVTPVGFFSITDGTLPPGRDVYIHGERVLPGHQRGRADWRKAVQDHGGGVKLRDEPPASCQRPIK
jgi:hypothetical protein